MAQNENALGAPTEGLGQNVTFAFDPIGPSALQLAGKGNVRTGVRGGGTVGLGGTQTRGIEVQKDNVTMDILTKIGGDMLQRRLKEKRTEAYVTGMQRAMAGEAVKNIAEEQPWYSTLFGTSDVVEGARAYAGQASASNTVAAMEDSMPELRKMGLAEANKFFVDTINKNLTGDAATDASVLGAMNKALPAVMRRHAKEHYAWTQENAVIQENKAFEAGATNLQAMGAGLALGTVTAEEFDVEAQRFARDQQPAAGRDLENWRNAKADSLESLGRRGMLHALNAVTKTGFLEVLTPDQRDKVAAAKKQGTLRVRSEWDGKYAAEIATITAQAKFLPDSMSPKDIQNRLVAMNNRFMRETGSEEGYFPPDKVTGLIEDAQSVIYRDRLEGLKAAQAEGKAAKTDAEKLQKKANELTYRVGMYNQGFIPITDGSQEKREAFLQIRNSTKIEERLPLYGRVFTNSGGAVDEDEKNARITNLDTMVATEDIAGVEVEFAGYNAMRAINPAMANAYYQDTQALRLEKYARLRGGGSPGELKLAFNGAFQTAIRPASFSKEDAKAYRKELASEVSSILPEWLRDDGGVDLREDQQDFLMQQLNEQIALGKDWSDSPAKAALGQWLASGRGEVLGGFAWSNSKGNKPIKNILIEQGQGTDTLELGFRDVVNKAVEKIGLSPSSRVTITRMPDQGRVARFFGIVDDEGTLKHITFTSQDLQAAGTIRLSNKAKQRAATKQGYNTQQFSDDVGVTQPSAPADTATTYGN
jgi:hypothetical protein